MSSRHHIPKQAVRSLKVVGFRLDLNAELIAVDCLIDIGGRALDL
ncbi:MAG TPA: hypothetical protein VNS63_04575 [Blastocatellia bacterium]|nr:hypothetical protein [Blastocatellia bacterium]